MKKTIIASAIGIALSAPAASFADATLYGRAHLSLDSLDNGADSAIYLSSNSSRLGVKGSEDLGNGLTILFQLEGGIAWDGGGSWGADRDTYVGLKGGAGTLLAGRLPAHNQWLGAVNLFADQIGDSRNLLLGARSGIGGRASNALNYAAPDLGGLKLSLTYVPDENPATDGDIWGVRAAYANGPLNLALTYFDRDASPNNITQTALTAGYNFGDFGLIAGYVTEENAASTDWQNWTIGGTAVVGAGKVKLQFVSAGESASSANDGATMWALGYDHPLSKRTTVYAAYARTNNDASASFSMAGAGHGDNPGAAAAGEDPNGFSFGIVHNF